MNELETLILAMLQDAKDEAKKENKGIEKATKATYDIYKSFVDAGFNEEQAFELTKILLRKEF